MDPARRRLVWAVVASATLHGVLLWPQSWPRPTAQLGLPLEVSFKPAPPPPAAPEAAVSRVSAAPRSLTSGRPATVRPVPKLTVDGDRKLPSPSFEFQAAQAADPAVEPSAELPDPAMALADPGPPGATPALPESAPDGTDGEALRQFRIAVARHVGHHDFPELAEEIGGGNASVVRVVVGPTAGTAKVAVAKSSGYARLDAKARDLIGTGVRATALPEALRGREFVTEFRVEFRPRDDNGSN